MTPTSPCAPACTAAALILACALAVAMTGCRTLSVTAQTSAKCDIVPGPPHLVRCTVDGEVRYEQRGPQKLNIEAAP
jgi:hypothetical protein